ncbi:hypothetical protein MXD59_01135 [Frankia sp. Ag45/Mut15]|uniref:DUF5753 domain-containing protein n=1 Tax=Frankia umida TaxID=573489 RepID=A0ABT0JSB5_9ACTN|nr:hypothetical protein [Frankia umida]MCK9874399.1 hypothetical protein [Frankia umida]
MPGQAAPVPSTALVPAVRRRYLHRADPTDSDAWPVGFSPTGEALPETLTDVLLRGSHAIRSSKRAEAQRLERAAAVANHVDAQLRDFLDFCAAEHLVPPVTVRAYGARPRRSTTRHPVPSHPDASLDLGSGIDLGTSPGPTTGIDQLRRLDHLDRLDPWHHLDGRPPRPDDPPPLAADPQHLADEAHHLADDPHHLVADPPHADDLSGPDGSRHETEGRRGSQRHHRVTGRPGTSQERRRRRPHRRERLQAWPLLYWRCESFPTAGRSLHLFVEPDGRTFEGRDDPAPLTVLGREVRVWPVDAAAIVAGMAEVDARRCALQLVHGMAHLLWRSGVGL